MLRQKVRIMSEAETFEIVFTHLVYGGDAMGRLPDGKAVFTPFALPGEAARIRLVEQRRGFARGQIVELLRSSPERVAPRCLHFGVCGGCHYQHLTYAQQLAAKVSILNEQLQRIGGLSSIPQLEPVPSPHSFDYRNHAQFHLTPDGRLGYHPAYSGEVLPIQECHLLQPALNAIWPQMEFEAGVDLDRIGLRCGVENEVQLILESGEALLPQFSLEELDLSVVHLSPAGSTVLAGNDGLPMPVLGRLFRVSAASFFQTNTAVAERMVEHVLDSLVLPPGATLLDVYCGVGLFSAFLAPRCAELIGVESSPSAVEDFVANLDEFEHISIYQATAEQALPALDLHPQAILVDPPRAGLSPVVIDQLLRLAASQLVYISCDPATLARDIRRLTAGGYQVEHVRLFDMFPQTYHIEAVVLMSRIE
jgi:23S rRNA (uracil1939-C5)-methyltransferase